MRRELDRRLCRIPTIAAQQHLEGEL